LEETVFVCRYQHGDDPLRPWKVDSIAAVADMKSLQDGEMMVSTGIFSTWVVREMHG